MRSQKFTLILVLWTSIVLSACSNSGSNSFTASLEGASSLFEKTQLQSYGDWRTTGNCGNEGGCTGAAPTYGFNQFIPTPSLNGNAMQFFISGNSQTPQGSFAGGYIFRAWLSEDLPKTLIKEGEYSFDLYLSSASRAASQAVEFEFEQKVGGFLYNMAWQADFGNTGHWRTFNYKTKTWDDSGLAISLTGFTPGSFHRIVVHNHLTLGSVYHDWISVDGKLFALNVHHEAVPFDLGATEFTNAFQIDLNRNNDAYNVIFDNMSLRLWR